MCNGYEQDLLDIRPSEMKQLVLLLWGIMSLWLHRSFWKILQESNNTPCYHLCPHQALYVDR